MHPELGLWPLEHLGLPSHFRALHFHPPRSRLARHQPTSPARLAGFPCHLVAISHYISRSARRRRSFVAAVMRRRGPGSVLSNWLPPWERPGWCSIAVEWTTSSLGRRLGGDFV